MGRLIRMDFYRLIQSKVFWISLLIFSGLQFILNFFNGMFANYNAETIADAAHKSYEWHTFNSPITEVIETPILSLFIIVLFISIVSFCHADQANGYIKNIAGQISNKGYTAISKFVIILFHNLVFSVCGAVSSALGKAFGPYDTVYFGGDFATAFTLFFIKFLLLLAMSAIILFVVTALRSSTFGTTLGVLFGISGLQLVYALLDKAINTVFSDVMIEKYAPSMLYFSSLGKTEERVTAVVVSIIFVVLFLYLTVKVFSKRDVK